MTFYDRRVSVSFGRGSGVKSAHAPSDARIYPVPGKTAPQAAVRPAGENAGGNDPGVRPDDRRSAGLPEGGGRPEEVTPSRRIFALYSSLCSRSRSFPAAQALPSATYLSAHIPFRFVFRRAQSAATAPDASLPSSAPDRDDWKWSGCSPGSRWQEPGIWCRVCCPPSSG